MPWLVLPLLCYGSDPLTSPSHLNGHSVLPMFGLVGEVRLLCARVPNQHLENRRRRLRKGGKARVLNEEGMNPAGLPVDGCRAGLVSEQPSYMMTESREKVKVR